MATDNLSSFHLRSPALNDVDALSQLAIVTFTETFGHLYDPDDLTNFLHQNYCQERIVQRLTDPSNKYQVIECGEELVGFASVGEVRVPIENRTSTDRELRQLYIKRGYQGRGLGRRLMDWAFEEFRADSASNVYLSVYSGNDRAIRFYLQYKFEKIGEYSFLVGKHIDLEWIMKLKAWP